MSDLVAFLNARLDEDEATAKAVHDFWQHLIPGAPAMPETRAYMARWDPARVLREVEAKRRILAEHHAARETWTELDGSLPAVFCARCYFPGLERVWPCATLRALAAVWSDHPDYDPRYGRMTPRGLPPDGS